MHAWATRESSRSSPLLGHCPPVVTNPARRPAHSAPSLALPLPLYTSPLCFPFTVPYFVEFFPPFSRTLRPPRAPRPFSPRTLLTPTGTPLAMVRTLGVCSYTSHSHGTRSDLPPSAQVTLTTPCSSETGHPGWTAVAHAFRGSVAICSCSGFSAPPLPGSDFSAP